jgi:hypothetical protein
MAAEIRVSIDGKKIRAISQTPIAKNPVNRLTRTDRFTSQFSEPPQRKTKWLSLVSAARQAFVTNDQA